MRAVRPAARIAAGLAVGAALAWSACAGPPPAPPTAVIEASPDLVCAGDGFATPIRLSGARSSPRLSLVPGAPDPSGPPLIYRWRLEGAEHHVVAGSLDATDVEVVTAGDRPLHATLTVTDVEGGEATSTRTVGLGFALAPPCDDGCAEGTECAPLGDASACLPTGECLADAECPPCFVCDAAAGRCVPPEGP